MRWHDVVTHDDALASLVRSQHRREVAERRARRRKRLRHLLLAPALIGAGILLWACTSIDDPVFQMEKIILGAILVLPFLSTYDVLGEAHR
jgi:ferric-dicitrate binding protein FerR (iron transport regulator)